MKKFDFFPPDKLGYHAPSYPQFTPLKMDFHAYLINEGDKRNCWVKLVGRPSANRIPLHLIACIDTSGSMGEDMRLENVKHTLTTILDFMTPADKLSLISFSHSSQVLMRQMQITDNSKKEQVKRQVDQLVAGGGTNLSAGLINVLGCLDTESGPAIKQVLLLLTDGFANQGLVEGSQIEQLVRQTVIAAPALTVATIGYGAEHNVEMMRTAATAGNGTYSAVSTLEDVAATVGETFGTMVTTVAQNVKLNIPAGANYIGALPVSNERRILIGDMGAGAEANLLFRLGPVGEGAEENDICMGLGYYDCVDMREMYTTTLTMLDGSGHVEAMKLYELRIDVSAFLLKHASARRLSSEERVRELAEADALLSRCVGDNGLVAVLRSDVEGCRARIERGGFTLLEAAQAAQNATFFGLGRGVYSQWSAASQAEGVDGGAYPAIAPGGTPGPGPALFHTFSSPAARNVSGGVVRAITGAVVQQQGAGTDPSA
jgi:Mg-chelatase subunit ChlD